MKKTHKKPHIAFIGLGTMGYPMAGHIAQNNFPITVYNRTHSKTLKEDLNKSHEIL